MVSTHLKNISQNGNLPSRGENKKYLKPPPRQGSSLGNSARYCSLNTFMLSKTVPHWAGTMHSVSLVELLIAVALMFHNITLEISPSNKVKLLFLGASARTLLLCMLPKKPTPKYWLNLTPPPTHPKNVLFWSKKCSPSHVSHSSKL